MRGCLKTAEHNTKVSLLCGVAFVLFPSLYFFKKHLPNAEISISSFLLRVLLMVSTSNKAGLSLIYDAVHFPTSESYECQEESMSTNLARSIKNIYCKSQVL